MTAMHSSAMLQFLGAAGTVTGSKHLVTVDGQQILLDCGLFQGLKALRLRNWQAPSFDAAHIDAVVVSHAHVDHSGSLPLLVRHGYHGPIFCTPATAALLRVMLLDAAHLQEEEAEFANRHGFSKHKPALPLYTTQDAEAALRLVSDRPYGQLFAMTGKVSALFRRAGLILGSATVELQLGPFRRSHLATGRGCTQRRRSRRRAHHPGIRCGPDTGNHLDAAPARGG